MINSLNCKLKLNSNVIISKLRNGQEYILLKIKTNYLPLFPKKQIMDLINYIKNSDRTKEDILKIYDKAEEDLKILLYKKIVLYDNDLDLEINMNCSLKENIYKLNSLAFKTRTPLHAKIEVTYNCNYRCKYCYVEDLVSKFTDINDIKVILDKLKENGVNELFITGGEPFMHPKIFDIIDYCSKLNFITTIQTNGSFINERIAEKLSIYKHLNIAISFHSCNADEFDKFTGVKGSFLKTIECSMYLKQYKINYFFKCNLTKNNEFRIKDIIKFLEENDIRLQIFTQILPNIMDIKDNSSYCINEKSLKWLYENKYLQFEKHICSAFKTKLWISPSGDVYPCELIRKSMGNIISQSFNSIWDGEDAYNLLNSSLFKIPQKCKNCSEKDYCNNCLAYLEYKNWNVGLKHFCTTAKVIKEFYSAKF